MSKRRLPPRPQNPQENALKKLLQPLGPTPPSGSRHRPSTLPNSISQATWCTKSSPQHKPLSKSPTPSQLQENRDLKAQTPKRSPKHVEGDHVYQYSEPREMCIPQPHKLYPLYPTGWKVYSALLERLQEYAVRQVNLCE